MKKIATFVVTAALAAAMSLGLPACTPEESPDSVSVYMPDGAPALAMAQLMVDTPDFGREVSYHVVEANLIQTYVSGEMSADVCVLPVNAAATVAGTGENYTMLGVVTHGNLYMVSSKYTDEITNENLTTLVGKSVGCIQLQSFVGTVFKAILDQSNIEYTVIENVSQATTDKVNLINIAKPTDEISPAAEYDYMVAAEPVITAKTSSGALSVVGDLQELYGQNGYPQAVMIAKNSLIENSPEFIDDLIAAVSASAEWVNSDEVSVEAIISAVNSNGGVGSLTVNNLKPDTISRCAINFVSAQDSREDVLEFIQKYNSVTGSSLTLSNQFFYNK